MKTDHLDSLKAKFTVAHFESSLVAVAPPSVQFLEALQVKVLLVQVDSSDGSRARVQVLVRTPSREINVPVVELELYVSDGMGKIPANVAALEVKK